MAIEVKRKEGENSAYLVSRFLKRVQQSGVLREAKKRRFHDRVDNRNKRRLSAIYRSAKRKEMERAKKLGLI